MKQRITKEKFYRNGGLSNRNQFRKAYGNTWFYYITL
jgi:hypothetical protein